LDVKWVDVNALTSQHLPPDNGSYSVDV